MVRLFVNWERPGRAWWDDASTRADIPPAILAILRGESESIVVSEILGDALIGWCRAIPGFNDCLSVGSPDGPSPPPPLVIARRTDLVTWAASACPDVDPDLATERIVRDDWRPSFGQDWGAYLTASRVRLLVQR